MCVIKATAVGSDGDEMDEWDDECFPGGSRMTQPRLDWIGSRRWLAGWVSGERREGKDKHANALTADSKGCECTRMRSP